MSYNETKDHDIPDVNQSGSYDNDFEDFSVPLAVTDTQNSEAREQNDSSLISHNNWELSFGHGPLFQGMICFRQTIPW